MPTDDHVDPQRAIPLELVLRPTLFAILTFGIFMSAASVLDFPKDHPRLLNRVFNSVRNPRFVVDLNSASATELEALPGMGPTVATRVVQFRQRYGPFNSVSELTEVRGIGSRTVADLQPYLMVLPTVGRQP